MSAFTHGARIGREAYPATGRYSDLVRRDHPYAANTPETPISRTTRRKSVVRLGAGVQSPDAMRQPDAFEKLCTLSVNEGLLCTDAVKYLLDIRAEGCGRQDETTDTIVRELICNSCDAVGIGEEQPVRDILVTFAKPQNDRYTALAMIRGLERWITHRDMPDITELSDDRPRPLEKSFAQDLLLEIHRHHRGTDHEKDLVGAIKEMGGLDGSLSRAA
jgi:hypothetical protein